MGYKPKTRVVIRCNGEDREIISIRILSSGDLLITLKGALTATHHGAYVPRVEQRYSVHCSPGSEGMLIKQTLGVTTGSVKGYQLRYPNDQGQLLALMYGHLMPDLNDSRYSAAPHARDVTVRPYGFQDAGQATLVYAVAVTTDRVSDFGALMGLKVTTIDFPTCRVVFMSGWFDAVPLIIGSLTHIFTSNPTVDGVTDGFQLPREALQSWTPDLLAHDVAVMVARLAKSQVEQATTFDFADRGILPAHEIDNLRRRLTKVFRDPDELNASRIRRTSLVPVAVD